MTPSNYIHYGEEMTLCFSKVDENGTWGLAFSGNMTPDAFVMLMSRAIPILHESGEDADWDYLLCQLPELIAGALVVLRPGIEARTYYRTLEYRIPVFYRAANWTSNPLVFTLEDHEYRVGNSKFIESSEFSPAKKDQKLRISIGPSKR